MDQMACVNLRALPLQLLLRDHPDWAGLPAVVVDRDKPNGIIQWSNRPARDLRILPGLRYDTGLSLSRELRGGAMPEARVKQEVEKLARRLWRFSPRIEKSDSEPGVFWLDVTGLLPLYNSFEDVFTFGTVMRKLLGGGVGQ